MSLDLTSFDAALKQYYTDETIYNMVYADNPLLAMMPKLEEFKGKNRPIPIIHGNPQGRSANFQKAQANKTNSQLKDFVLTRSRDYSLASIDNETIEASKGDAGAFLEAATVEIDGAIQSATRSLAIAMYGTGSGTIGSVAASTNLSSTTIELARVEDVTNFEVGMKLEASATDGGSTVRAGTVTVVGVDRDAGKVEVSVALNTGIAAIAAGDFLSQEGDYDSKIKGLQAWLPATAPVSGDNFFSVDRSADSTRLGGIRYDGTAEPIEEALISAANRIGREGGKPDYCFMSYSKYADLEKALGSKVQYTEMTHERAELSFRGILVHGPRGPIRVVPDQNCPSDRAFMLQMNVWKVYSLGKCPKIIEQDGLKMLRESNADAVEVRVGYYAQLGCRAPGFNATIKLG